MAEGLNLGGRLNSRRPIHSILMKSLLFAIAFLCFHVLEHVAIGLWHGKEILESLPEGGDQSLKIAVIKAIIMTFILCPYFAFNEIGRLTGESDLLLLILGRKQPPEQNARSSSRGAA